jgi:hypothetical protein
MSAEEASGSAGRLPKTTLAQIFHAYDEHGAKRPHKIPPGALLSNVNDGARLAMVIEAIVTQGDGGAWLNLPTSLVDAAKDVASMVCKPKVVYTSDDQDALIYHLEQWRSQRTRSKLPPSASDALPDFFCGGVVDIVIDSTARRDRNSGSRAVSKILKNFCVKSNKSSSGKENNTCPLMVSKYRQQSGVLRNVHYADRLRKNVEVRLYTSNRRDYVSFNVALTGTKSIEGVRVLDPSDASDAELLRQQLDRLDAAVPGLVIDRSALEARLAATCKSMRFFEIDSTQAKSAVKRSRECGGGSSGSNKKGKVAGDCASPTVNDNPAAVATAAATKAADEEAEEKPYSKGFPAILTKMRDPDERERLNSGANSILFVYNELEAILRRSGMHKLWKQVEGVIENDRGKEGRGGNCIQSALIISALSKELVAAESALPQSMVEEGASGSTVAAATATTAVAVTPHQSRE